MKLSIIFLLLFLSFSSMEQNLTGTWEGSFKGRILPGSNSYFMYMELNQTGRKLEGIFYYAAIDRPKEMYVMYEVSGELGKKKLFPFRLIRGSTLFNQLVPGINDGFLQFENIQFYKKENKEYLSGNWISDRRSDFAGTFSIKKVDTTHLSLDKKVHIIKGKEVF